MGFESDMNKIAGRLGNKFDLFGRKLKFDLFSSVIRDTRVDTGRLRGGWQVSEDTPITSDNGRTWPKGTPESQLTSEVQETVQGRSVSYLTNSVNYAIYREEKDAMIARNVARAKRFVRDAERSLRV